MAGGGGAKAEEGPTAPPAKSDRPGILDYWLGTNAGRARLLWWIWVLSVIFLGLGYGLVFWIFSRGGL